MTGNCQKSQKLYDTYGNILAHLMTRVSFFSNMTLVELKLGAKSEGFFKLRHLRCLTIICVKPLLLHQLSTKCVLHFPNLIIFFCETLIAFSTAEKLHTYI